MTNEVPARFEGGLNAAGFRVALVVSRFNSTTSERLLDGAMDCLQRHGAAREDLTLVRVPGSFEIPLTARKLAKSGKHDAVICLGAVIRGETPHFELVAAEVTKGIATVGLETGIPVTFGVVTAENPEQAADRAGGKMGNRGADAAMAAIEMVDLLRRLEV
jgi:6,7-dimethyl-8-ribityllumazine synthase